MQAYERLSEVDLEVPPTALELSNLSTSQTAGDELLHDASSFEITLMFLEAPSLQVLVSGQWTVTELCVHIPALCNLLEDGNRLRFLHQGIQLPDHNTLTDCGIHAGSCIQVSVSHSVPEAPAPAPPQAAAPPPSLDSDDIVVHVPPYMEPMMVDFSDEDEEGTYSHMICGLLMGFAFGPVMVLWLLQSIPRKQKLGMSLGILCNVILSVIRTSLRQNDPTPAPSVPRGRSDPGDVIYS